MVTLIVRKTIRATAERLFAAWTISDQLKLWWGPQGVKCIDAEVDLIGLQINCPTEKFCGSPGNSK
jgi:hypothetical protein